MSLPKNCTVLNPDSLTMALDIVGPTKRAAIDDEDYFPLFQMLQDFGIKAPQSQIIYERFWQNPCVDPPSWLAEIRQLREAYIAQLAVAKNIRAKDPEIREQILYGLVKTDRWLAKFDELIAVCEDAIAADCGLKFWSD